MQVVSVLAAGAMIAGSIFYVGHSNRYTISGQGKDALRIDTHTGDVSYCHMTKIDEMPICSPFGSQTLAEFRADRAALNKSGPTDINDVASSGQKQVDPEFLDRLEKVAKELRAERDRGK